MAINLKRSTGFLKQRAEKESQFGRELAVALRHSDEEKIKIAKKQLMIILIL